ncbi:MAG: hypothetical protein LBQ59_04895 [Candidatus Peribacteria bacterium]|jgi:hypothetical protein|nr:hypothetical protein [Candidatus Peribacteria bacterium]
MTDEQKAQMEEIRTILTKQRAGETLTEEETAKLETLKPFNSRFNTHFGDKNITKFTQKLGNTEAMKSMTDEEKQAYLIELKAKFEELRAKQEVKETVIDKLLI